MSTLQPKEKVLKDELTDAEKQAVKNLIASIVTEEKDSADVLAELKKTYDNYSDTALNAVITEWASE